jgi:hypothetical protein
MLKRNWARATARFGQFAVLVLAVLVQFRTSLSQDKTTQESTPPLGSSITFEEFRTGNMKRDAPPTEEGWTARPKARAIRTVQAAEEIVPHFRYRFWPHPRSVQPGNAFVRYSRALTLFLQVSRSTSQKQSPDWNDFVSRANDYAPNTEALDQLLEPYSNVLLELEEFGKCEDLSWDHRLRDVQGPKIYSFLLPEVQEARSLARLLYYRGMVSIQKGDFDDAISRIRTGYRLSAFVRSGETLIQQLVGIAIEATMQDLILYAMEKPGCPNLYWALATVPHSPSSMQRSIELELSTVEKLLPVLANAETSDWEQAVWKRKWQESMRELEKLGAGSGVGGSQLPVLIVAQLAIGSQQARKRLIQSGRKPEGVDAMCDEQVMALDGLLQLREWGDRLASSTYLPQHLTGTLQKKDNEAFESWSRNSQSFASTLGGLLYPAVWAAMNAEQRIVATHHRLMTIEAVRHYAATHNKRLPTSLNELERLPAMTDPFTNQPIGYSVTSENGKETAEFTVAVPNSPEEQRSIRISIAK